MIKTLKGIQVIILFSLAAINAYCQENMPVKPTPQWRPKYHFTPPKNWTNDPNGLLFLNGEYHLYYQHNPFENKWGHMSWGHATSKNLLHWQHLPVAIPEILSEDTTTWIYSGSAVIDKYNTSGFGKNGKAPIVAIFTADQPKQKKETQFVAYSNNDGLSYQMYAGNPVIDLNMRDFRDPNVFWFEPAKQWIMTVAMVDEHMVRLYGSKNLKDWQKLSDFGPAGYTKNGWECPTLLPLAIDGNPANTKWVLLVSSGGDHGPLMQYYVGDFDGVTFTNINPANQLLKVDYGDAFYAAIAWRNAPQNKKILLGWLQNGRQETYPWKGQMSAPRDLALKTTPEGLRLYQPPAATFAQALLKPHGKLAVKKNTILNDTIVKLNSNGYLDSNAVWIDAEIQLQGATNAGFYLAQKGADVKIAAGYDAVKHELYVDCTTAEKGNKSPANLILTAPMKAVKGIVKIKILLDKSSLEVFGNDGEKVISTMIYPDKDATGISVFSHGKSLINSMKIYDLNDN